MNGIEEAEDEISALREEIDYLESLIADFADARVFDIALSALRNFKNEPFRVCALPDHD